MILYLYSYKDESRGFCTAPLACHSTSNPFHLPAYRRISLSASLSTAANIEINPASLPHNRESRNLDFTYLDHGPVSVSHNRCFITLPLLKCATPFPYLGSSISQRLMSPVLVTRVSHSRSRGRSLRPPFGSNSGVFHSPYHALPAFPTLINLLRFCEHFSRSFPIFPRSPEN